MSTTLARFLGLAFTAGGATQDDETSEQILDAVLAEAAARGLGSLAMERVAQRAGINRVTIYRRFGDRDGLVSALAAREGLRMSAALAAVSATIADPEDRLVEGFVAALRYAAEHPLIRRAAEHEPESLIAAGMADDARLLRIATDFLAGEFRALQADGLAPGLDPQEAGETVARLFASFVLLPGGALDPTDEAAMRRYARRTLAPMVIGSVSHPDPAVPRRSETLPGRMAR